MRKKKKLLLKIDKAIIDASIRKMNQEIRYDNLVSMKLNDLPAAWTLRSFAVDKPEDEIMGLIEALENYKPIPADFVEPLPDWVLGGYEFMQKYGLLDMSSSIVKVACGYGVIYATDYAIEAAERFCCDNWHEWLRSLV